MWILLLQGDPEEHFSPALGLPRWAAIVPHQSLMWFGRTWRGRAGPRVISRAVTSETHFPTIKEREKLSGPNIARFHDIESNICMCVCECVCERKSSTSPPQSLTDTHSFPTLNSDRAFPNVFTYEENHLSQKREISALILRDKQIWGVTC